MVPPRIGHAHGYVRELPRSVAFDRDLLNLQAFAEACQRPTAAGVEVSRADPRIGWGLHFEEPDGSLLEPYCDTRAEPDGAAQSRGRNLERAACRISAVVGA